jgi:hypothetical protein
MDAFRNLSWLLCAEFADLVDGLPNGPTASAASSGTRPTRLWLLENKNLIAFGERSGDAGDSLHRYEEDICFPEWFRVHHSGSWWESGPSQPPNWITTSERVIA